MSINLGVPEKTKKLKPRVLVLGVGGGGCNALNTMIASKTRGVEFVACNTDAQSLEHCNATHKIQLGISQTQGLGAGSDPDIGKAAAEESYNEVCEYIEGAHMAFVTAGMGGGTGTGAIPVLAKACKEKGILTVAVVTKPFTFEGSLRMQNAEKGINELREFVDTLIVIPNQNLFIVSDEKTTYAEALSMADQVLTAGVQGITDLMMLPGLINLDFADIKTVMSEMGRAVLGNGEAGGEKRALESAEDALSNHLLDHTSIGGAKWILLNISGGSDMTLVEVHESVERIRDESPDANIIYGASINKELDGLMKVSIVATGIEPVAISKEKDKKNDRTYERPDVSELPKQTDLEDFTNAPAAEIVRNTEFNHSNDKILNKLTEPQEKLSKKVIEFVKKFSPLKIFKNRKKEVEVEQDNKFETTGVILNKFEKKLDQTEDKKRTMEIKNHKTDIENQPKIEPIEESKKETKEETIVQNKTENNLIKEKELNKDENKTVEIQAEMPGISSDSGLPEDSQNIDKKNDNNENNQEDLEIPSFLRNQSN